MSPREFLEVDPATLHVPGSRSDGADPFKLQRQIAKHGVSIEGMPPIEVSRGTDGELVINNGVTRATRVARCLPGTSRLAVPNDRKFIMANDSTRNELQNAIAELGWFFPDWRLGQTLANLAMSAGYSESSAIWDLEDDEALMVARRLIEQNACRQANDPNKSLSLNAKSVLVP